MRLADAWREAPARRVAIGWILQYAALRVWALLIGCFPVETNLRTGRLMGSLWWLLLRRSRQRAMDNLRHAYPDLSDAQRRRIGRECCRHFAQLYLVELALTPRLINRWSWARYVELDALGPALRELLRDRGALLLTPHFGNYELLGYCLAELGFPLAAVMRPLDNPLITAYLCATRQACGLELLFKKGAMQRADDIIAAGRPLCFIADQDAGRKGVFAEFFGRPASWYKSIGLLAMRHRVPVIVGAARRVSRGMRYRISVQRIIRPADWERRDRPLEWITAQFAQAMESAIRAAPEQYLWVHRRWKTQPPGPAPTPPQPSAASAAPSAR